MRKVICGLLILGSLFAVVGCSRGEASPTPTATAKTPIQVLDESVTTRFTAVWDLINSHTTSITNLGNRIGTLEGQSTASYTEDINALKTRVSTLESYNLSGQIGEIQAEIAFVKLQLSGLPTPTPVGATPTPTTTPIVYCGIHNPTAIYPKNQNTTVSNISVDFEWSGSANVIEYELWVGFDLNDMDKYRTYTITDSTRADSYMETYAVAPSTTYFWRIVSKDACGNIASNTWWFKTQ